MSGNIGVYARLNGAGTTTVRTGFGCLRSITLNTPGIAGTVSVFDNTAGSGTTIAAITTVAGSVVPSTLIYDCAFTTGLTIVITGAQDVTVVVS